MQIIKPKIKICCIASVEEARLAIYYGASAIGLVSEMPSGPGVISEELIEKIAVSTPPAIGTFLLTSKTNVDDIIAQQRRCKTNTIQLCDRLKYGTHKDLKNQLPGISIVQVVHITGDESIEEAINVSQDADAILLDSGNQNLEIKELGGTGKTHNWNLSKQIVLNIKKPVFLAGGLNTANIKQAIDFVQPYGVDLCNGVRSDGILDKTKLETFINQI
jgi:phosphoribosylanthranilate isomerase